MDQCGYIIPQNRVGASPQNGEVNRASAQVRAKRSSAVIMVTALRDGMTRELYLATVKFLRMSKHCHRTLVERPAVDLNSRVIVGRLLATERFRRGSGSRRLRGRRH